MITFNDVLRAAGLDPAQVQLARHQDARVQGHSIYALWRSPGGADLVEEYQAVQAQDRFDIAATSQVSLSPRHRGTRLHS